MRRLTVFFTLGFLLFFLTVYSFAGSIFKKSEYTTRRQKLMQKIPDGAAVLLGAQIRVAYNEFYQNNDFMYLSGVEAPDAVLIIDGKRRSSTLFLSLSAREARSEGISLDLVNKPKQATGIERVLPREEFTPYLNRLVSQDYIIYTSYKPEELMRECSNEKLRTLRRNMTLNKWDGRLTRELRFIELMQERYPQVEIKDCSSYIWDLRTIKSPAEIELLRKAGKIGVKAHIEMIKSTRPGMFEYELAALYEFMCKKEGAHDLSYYMIICSGENHPYLHYHKHDRKLQAGDFLVIDVGPDLDYYDIDITVSYPVNGKFTPRQREVYEAANAVHEANMQIYRPGLTVAQARQEVRKILLEKGFDLSKDYFKKMRGGFGHYVGMAVHDVGGGPNVLQEGMVIANEPLVVYPDENLGVRVEDTILITADGCENLTAGLPRTVAEIEGLMK